MLKMLLDVGGGILVTNDGNAILLDLDLAHPAAKSMIELSCTQDEEVGDGKTSVIVLGKSNHRSLSQCDIFLKLLSSFIYLGRTQKDVKVVPININKVFVRFWF